MAEERPEQVTMRIRFGESELEVTGPRDFVEKKIEEFLALQERLPSRLHRDVGSLKHAPSSEATTGAMSEAQFFRKVATKTDVDRILAAGYFLEVYKQQESFTAIEARDVIRGAKIPPPKNPNDAINKNIKKGYMMAAGDKDGKMAFVLTSDGDEAMAAALKA